MSSSRQCLIQALKIVPLPAIHGSESYDVCASESSSRSLISFRFTPGHNEASLNSSCYDKSAERDDDSWVGFQPFPSGATRQTRVPITTRCFRQSGIVGNPSDLVSGGVRVPAIRKPGCAGHRLWSKNIPGSLRAQAVSSLPP